MRKPPDVGGNGAACGAGVHAVHAVETFEDVACRIGVVAFEVFFAQIGVGDVFAVLPRFAFWSAVSFLPRTVTASRTRLSAASAGSCAHNSGTQNSRPRQAARVLRRVVFMFAPFLT